METTSRARAFLSLGSNLEDREGNLRRALGLLEANAGIEVDAVSSLYETRPVGVAEQPDFINLVAEVKASLSPHELLRRCLEVENEMGRVRGLRWGPRLIDVDVLLYGDEVSDDEELVLPHPEMLNRAFVLVPLLEIAPGLEMPGGGPVAAALEALPEEEKEGVVKVGETGLPVEEESPVDLACKRIFPRAMVVVAVFAVLAVLLLVVSLLLGSSGVKQMVIETGQGTVVLELDEKAAPETCRHIEAMVDNGSYQGASFYYVAEDAAFTGIQGRNTTTGVETGAINKRGAVGMAKPSNPATGTPMADSGTNEFYILKEDVPSLDPSFTIFGQVTEGMDLVDGLTPGTVINSITLNEIGDKLIIAQDAGDIVIELDAEETPQTVAHITDLINQGFYAGMNWYRVENFVAQTGSHARSLEAAGADQAAVKQGAELDKAVPTVADELKYTAPDLDPAMLTEETRTVPDESGLPAVEGAVLLFWIPPDMSSREQSYMPEYPTEFVILKQDLSQKIGTELIVFGRVVEGMDVVDALKTDEKITDIHIREK